MSDSARNASRRLDDLQPVQPLGAIQTKTFTGQPLPGIREMEALCRGTEDARRPRFEVEEVTGDEVNGFAGAESRDDRPEGRRHEHGAHYALIVADDSEVGLASIEVQVQLKAGQQAEREAVLGFM